MTATVITLPFPLSRRIRRALRRFAAYYTREDWTTLAWALPLCALAGLTLGHLGVSAVYWLSDHTWQWWFA